MWVLEMLCYILPHGAAIVAAISCDTQVITEFVYRDELTNQVVL